MKLDPLPPIPSPVSHHWRRLRVNVMPLLAFGVVLVCTVWLWGRNLVNPLLLGTAEGPQADVASPKPGHLAQLKVILYQEVKAGDVIAIVEPIPPAILTNTLAVIHAEIELVRTQAGFDAGDRVRYAQFQLALLLAKADLVTARAQSVYATNEYQRVVKLLEQKIVDPQQYDIALRDLEMSRRLLEEKTAAVCVAEKVWEHLDPARPADENPSVKAAIAVAEEKLRLADSELRPLILTAPINGLVSKIDKLAGSTVTAGEAIVTIASPGVDRIVGYLGQPLRIQPRVGMPVVVRTRGLTRFVGRGEITHVGPRVELFTAPLRVRGMGAAQERGLPILVNVPANLKLLPGEMVDITLVIGGKKGS